MDKLVARLLGIIALVPFIAAVLASWLDLGPFSIWWQREYIVYFAAIVASFTGAVHWGRAVEGAPKATILYVYSICPAIIAWGALLTEYPRLILILAFLVSLGGDWHFFRKIEDRAWYVQLRILLTITVIACLVAS